MGDEKESNKHKEEVQKANPTNVLVNEISVPSGRQDGKGQKITVVYLAGGNPI
jgi:hypothetical protein